MTFSLSSSDLKVPIAFVTCCYHTPSSIKERAHSHLSYSVSSVKDGIVFPSFHIFARVDREKSIRILNVWTRIKKRGESLVRCRRGLNINYGSICIWFILRTLTTDYQHIQKYICLILLLLTVRDQDSLGLFFFSLPLVTAYIFVINYQPSSFITVTLIFTLLLQVLIQHFRF